MALAVASLRQAFNGLWGATTVPALLERACAEACTHFAAERTWLARAEADSLLIVAVHVEPADELELARRAFVGRRMLVEPGTPEADALRLCRPVVVDTHTIVAPVVVDDRCVGIMAVEREPDAPELGDDDCETLGVFAQGVAFAAGRVALLERLRAQRRYVTEMAVSAQAIATELCMAPVDPLSSDTETLAVISGGVALTAAPPAESAPLLSRRERDVIELLATGATNGAIAERLCLSEETVKTHVQRILRKLRATNRAQAVSRYLQYS